MKVKEALNKLTKSSMPWDESSLRMYHSIGRPPISTMGLGRSDVSSLMRVPRPPAQYDCLHRPLRGREKLD